MIKGLLDSSTQDLIEGKVRVGISVFKIPKQETFIEEDVKGNKITYTNYGGEKHEVINDNSKELSIKVSREKYPNAGIKSLDYFVLPSELEEVYGKRANSIMIVFKNNELDEILPNSLQKYANKALACYGDKEKASRFDEETNSRIEVPCPCAYYTNFPDVVNTIKFDESLQKRTIKDTKQILVQGAWRNIIKYNKETGDLQLEELKKSCKERYRLKFMCPEVEGINLYQFEGSGLTNLKYLLNQLVTLQEVFSKLNNGSIAGIPFYLRVKLQEQNLRTPQGNKKKIFPRVYLHLPFKNSQMLLASAQKTFGTEQKQLEAPTEVEYEDINPEESF